MLTGETLLGRDAVAGVEAGFQGIDPRSGALLEPVYRGSSEAQVAEACRLASLAARPFRAALPEVRARLLERIADGLEAAAETVIARASAETGLPVARLQGEHARTTGQLRLFARVVRQTWWRDERDDAALPERQPAPRPALRLRQIALGPVAVFGASNFPLAFSVAGGDTASALAAGCPVVVKAHSAHPGTSELVGRVVQQAVAETGLPAGVFSLLYGSGREVGTALVADPRIKAAGFTGSRVGGLALVAIAQKRPEPIPVYAEMSSINPVILLPDALRLRAEDIANRFVASLTLGVGQFCTNPGLVVAIDGPGLDHFVDKATGLIRTYDAGVMLTGGMRQNYDRSVRSVGSARGVRQLAAGQTGDGPAAGQAAFFELRAEDFERDTRAREEMFGPASLLVRCRDEDEVARVLDGLEGQLTITLQAEESDHDAATRLLPILEEKAGRLLVNDFPTGVEVADAMFHGGPFPATSSPASTSVGSLAIRRFLRPVCYQNFPAKLLQQAS